MFPFRDVLHKGCICTRSWDACRLLDAMWYLSHRTTKQLAFQPDVLQRAERPSLSSLKDSGPIFGRSGKVESLTETRLHYAVGRRAGVLACRVSTVCCAGVGAWPAATAAMLAALQPDQHGNCTLVVQLKWLMVKCAAAWLPAPQAPDPSVAARTGFAGRGKPSDCNYNIITGAPTASNSPWDLNPSGDFRKHGPLPLS